MVTPPADVAVEELQEGETAGGEENRVLEKVAPTSLLTGNDVASLLVGRRLTLRLATAELRDALPHGGDRGRSELSRRGQRNHFKSPAIVDPLVNNFSQKEFLYCKRAQRVNPHKVMSNRGRHCRKAEEWRQIVGLDTFLHPDEELSVCVFESVCVGRERGSFRGLYFTRFLGLCTVDNPSERE